MSNDSIRADIRRAVRRASEPFDGRKLLPFLNRDYTFKQVQNHLHGLAERGELKKIYLQRGRRKDSVMFRTTTLFGDQRDAGKKLSLAMNRLDQALRGWYGH